MFYNFLMLVTIHGHTEAYRLDYHLSKDNCTAMLEIQPEYQVRKSQVEVQFLCEIALPAR